MLGFLSITVRPYVFILVALLGAAVFMRLIKLPLPEKRQWLVAWLVLTTAAFFGGHFLVYAVVVAIVCMNLSRRAPSIVPSIYIALLPVMPLNPYTIPGPPGINQLFNLDHQRMLTLALLLPALLGSRQTPQARTPAVRSGVDFFFFLFVAWVVLLAILHRPTPTDKLRAVFDAAVFLLVPYLAVSRLIRTTEDMKRALLALVFTGIIVTFIGLMEQRMTWYFYQRIPLLLRMNELQGFEGAQEMRFGMLRIKSSVGGGLGYVLIFSLCACLCLGRMRLLNGWRLFVLVALIGVAVLFTGSRAAWIIAGIALASTLAFSIIKSPVRFVIASCLGLLLIPAAQRYFLTTSDSFGTFDYRADLLRSSIPLVWERPILGWDSATELFGTGKLEHLRQGQGIIDMVNTYLGEALNLGIPGFLMFCLILFSALWAVLRRHNRAGLGLPFESPIASFLTSLVLVTTFYLATISMVGHIPSYLWLLAALCSAYAALPASEALPAREPGLAPQLRQEAQLQQPAGSVSRV